MARRPDDDKDESPMYMGVTILAILCIFSALLWVVASNKIVYHSLSPGLAAGSMWKLYSSDYTFTQWNKVVGYVQQFGPNPSAVSVFTWMSFITTAFRPLMVILMIVYVGVLIALGFKKSSLLMRKITADMLMLHSMKHFTGIAPVVAIRKQIATDKNVLWRRQVTPEEVFLNYKVPRLGGGIANGSLAKSGMPMMRDKKFDREVARAYFLGIEKDHPDGRIVSRMLGIQVVNLEKDAKAAKSKVFSDRMSSEGKTLIGLWASIAFGGKAGRDEFCLYRDKLNLSAYGTKDGIANLALAQPLYDKYRKNPLLNKLFAIHHWEHTVLFALLALAQKKGRYTTAEVLWLRPMNRVMFFSLNTRGSYTPHTESASTFSQHAYENACAKANRLPMGRSADGRLIHRIYIDKAIDGLELECMRWLDAGTDDDDDWWQNENIWKRASPTIDRYSQMVTASIPTTSMPGVEEDEVTVFDKIESQRAESRAAEEKSKTDDDFGDFLRSSGGASGLSGFQ